MPIAGIIGIGDMGSGLAANLIKGGFTVHGFDLKPERMKAFGAMGGMEEASAAHVGQHADTVFIMVMNGGEVETAIFGNGADEAGLLSTLKPGSTIVLTATIKPKEAKAIAARLKDADLRLVDSPVSGGRPGAEGGTLTLMAAGKREALDAARPAMEAISATIHTVGTEIGEGQTMKACLQALIGSIFTGAFEACGLAAKAGVDADALNRVFSTSAAGCGITNAAVSNVIAGTFEKTGSHINTMHKDLTISLDLAQDLGVPLFTAATAMQLFAAGRTRHPDGDNQVVAKVTEEIIGTGLRK
ncbi:NAD(P)-dependent oxidoreductase [Pseudahrensia aquimaris]|uniref:NAD(P)-dependent oxidoreductase n=1 Tax=Pseudahrensia aquimaris TaxID=744461 RepID=A0ABW3FDY6_9HYPH